MNANEITRILKENVGLKLGYENYKRKYRAINRILQRKLWFKIEGFKTQYVHLAVRLQHVESEAEREAIRAVMQFITKERKELEEIYELCREVSK